MKEIYSSTIKHLFMQALHKVTEEHLIDQGLVHLSKKPAQFEQAVMEKFILSTSKLQELALAHDINHGAVIQAIQDTLHQEHDNHNAMCQAVFEKINSQL
jgi:hypothetical protein